MPGEIIYGLLKRIAIVKSSKIFYKYWNVGCKSKDNKESVFSSVKKTSGLF
jgi:hypothetical protein